MYYFPANELKELENLVCEKRDDELKVAQKTPDREIELVKELSRDCMAKDVPNLLSLIDKIRSAKLTFEAVKEHR